MATLNIKLKTHRQKNDGTYPIAFQLVIDRKPNYEHSGRSVKESQFKEGTSDWVRRHPDSVLINRNLEIRRSEIMKNLLDAEAGKFPLLAKAIFSGNPSTGMTLGRLLDERANYFSENESSWYYRLRSIKKELLECWGKDMELNEITLKEVEQYQFFLNKRGNSNNTIAKKMKTVRTLIKKKMELGEYVGKNSFAALKMNLTPVRKEKLTWEELRALEEVKLVGKIDDVRKLFLFSFHAQGMRFENCILLMREDIKEDKITYRMNKGKKIREILIHPKLKAIIDYYLERSQGSPYLFPFVEKAPKNANSWRHKKDELNALVNKYLKRIAILAGIEKNLTMHIARHTFAYLLKKYQADRGESNIYVIQEALGHSDIKTTQMYLESLDDDRINKAIVGMYNI